MMRILIWSSSGNGSINYLNEDWVPFLVTESLALSIPSCIESILVLPEPMPYENAPINASPAPVVSTAFTFGAGIRTTLPSSTVTAPFSPMVIINSEAISLEKLIISF